MSTGRDPVVMVGVALVGIAALAWFLTLDDGGKQRPKRSSRSDSASQAINSSSGEDPQSTRRTETNSGDESRDTWRTETRRRAPLRPWLPTSAREVTANDALPKAAHERSGCQPAVSPIDIARNVVLGFERGLREATGLSVSEETKIGREIERELNQVPMFRGKLDRGSDRKKYEPWIRAIVERIRPHTNRNTMKYSIHIIRDERFNAFALPGGVMAFHTGLFEGPNALKSEAELAAIVGHEMAHVDLRHPIAAYQYAKRILGEDADGAQIINVILKTGIGSTYELEADAHGNALMARGQYDPSASVRLWKRQSGSERGGGVAGVLIDILTDTVESLFRSHPPAHARCHQAERSAAAVREERLYEVYYRGESNIRSGVSSGSRVF